MATLKTVEVLVQNHQRFRAFLERRVGNAEDAEDILQAAFLKTVEKGGSIRENESAVAWFYRLLRNALADHYRHHAAQGRALERVQSLSPHAEEPDTSVEQAVCQCVLALLPTLREDYATLIQRVDLEDASIADVASEIGLSRNNVRVRLHRARRALRKQLEISCGSCTEHGCLDCTCKHDAQHNH